MDPIKDIPLRDRKRGRKAQYPVGIEPTTSRVLLRRLVLYLYAITAAMIGAKYLKMLLFFFFVRGEKLYRRFAHYLRLPLLSFEAIILELPLAKDKDRISCCRDRFTYLARLPLKMLLTRLITL